MYFRIFAIASQLSLSFHPILYTTKHRFLRLMSGYKSTPSHLVPSVTSQLLDSYRKFTTLSKDGAELYKLSLYHSQCTGIKKWVRFNIPQNNIYNWAEYLYRVPGPCPLYFVRWRSIHRNIKDLPCNCILGWCWMCKQDWNTVWANAL